MVCGWRNVLKSASPISLSSQQADALLEYSRILLERNKRQNLTGSGIRTTTDVLHKHILDSLCLLKLIRSTLPAASHTTMPAPSTPPHKQSADISSAHTSPHTTPTPSALPLTRVVDVGTGGGIPGIILAISDPALHVTLLEARSRKTDFLRDCLAELGPVAANTEVVWGRAEDFAHEQNRRGAFDVVVARGVTELRHLVELCLPLLKLGGFGFFPKLLDEQTLALPVEKISAREPNQGDFCEVSRAMRAIHKLGGRLVDCVARDSLSPTPPLRTPTDRAGDFGIVVVKGVTVPGRQFPRSGGQVFNKPL